MCFSNVCFKGQEEYIFKKVKIAWLLVWCARKSKSK